ncbi:MAG: hypothetical protein ACI9EW_003081 [Cellvibrionaceae bacterium]|jgi:hypothetical protein
MLRRILSRLTVIIFGLLLGLILVEGLARLFRPVLPPVIQLMMRDVKKHPFTQQTILPPPAWRPVDVFQMAVVPGLDNELQYPNANVNFQVSSKNWLNPDSNIGFRVDSVDWEPRWPVDVVTVGDSFTFCFTEYEDCWVRRLETDHGLSVVNLGQGATGGVSHANVLFTFGLPYKPKVVLWQWYGNDNNEDYGLVYQWGESDTKDRSALEPKGWIVRNSIVFALIDILTNASDFGRESYISQADLHVIEVAGEPMFYGRSYSWETADLSLEKNRLGQQKGFEAILVAQERLAAEGVELIIFPVPYKEEVYRPWIEHNSDFDMQKIDNMEANRAALLQFCFENELNCFDPTAELITQALSGDALYFSQDTHLNAYGNEILLKIIHQQLAHLDE